MPAQSTSLTCLVRHAASRCLGPLPGQRFSCERLAFVCNVSQRMCTSGCNNSALRLPAVNVLVARLIAKRRKVLTGGVQACCSRFLVSCPLSFRALQKHTWTKGGRGPGAQRPPRGVCRACVRACVSSVAGVGGYRGVGGGGPSLAARGGAEVGVPDRAQPPAQPA